MTKSKGGSPETIGPVDIPDVLSILPLRNSVLFPASVVPVNVGRARSVRLIEESFGRDRPLIGVVAQKESDTEDPEFEDVHALGTVARVLKVIRLSSGNYSVVLQGVSRMRMYCVGRSPAVMDAAPITSGMRAPVDSPRKIIGAPRCAARSFMCAILRPLTCALDAPMTVKSLATTAQGPISACVPSIEARCEVLSSSSKLPSVRFATRPVKGTGAP